MEYARIALFVYNRLWHTEQTIEALKKNALAGESELFIFSDGPKDISQESNVKRLRDWLKTISGFKNIQIIEREKNLGLAQSIITGVTELVNQYGKVIVLEDDIVTSPYFLTYMNEALTLYERDEQVASIHAYALPLSEPMPETYFLYGADCWGWATWQRAWSHFESNGQTLLLALENNGAYEFDFQGTQPNIQMLKDQISGKNNSWAIRWHASAFIKKMLTLYPKNSLVKNIGLDNSGEHCVNTTLFDVTLTENPIGLTKLPLQQNQHAYQAYVNFHQKSKPTLLKRVLRRIERLISC